MTNPTSPVQIAEFRRLWLARFTSSLATSGMVVILGYQLYDLARSDYGMSVKQAALQLGLLGFVQFMPMLLLAPIAGVVADRFDRRTVAALATFTDLLVALALALFTLMNMLSLPLLFTLAALHGSARSFIGPAISSFAPNIVPANLLPRAVALSSVSWQAGGIGGPALAGLLYGIDSSAPYWNAVALLALSWLFVLTLRRLLPTDENRTANPFRQIVEGFRYVWKERFLLGCVTLDLFAVLLGGATALLPVFARDILHVGPEGLGIMRAAPAAGAAVVSLWLSFRPINNNVGPKMLWSVVIYGVATVLFGISHNFWFSLVMLATLGMADMVSVFIRSSLVQLNTPDDMRGRVNSIAGLAVSASNELGEMQSGLAAAALGATGAVIFGGAGAVVVTALWAWLFPELKNVRTFAPQYNHKESSP